MDRPKFPVLETLQSATEALRRNWGRAVLTSLSMVVGTASLVLVVVAGISGRNYTLDQIRGVGSNLIYVHYEASETASGLTTLSDKLTFGDLKAVQTQLPGVRSAAPLVLDYDSWCSMPYPGRHLVGTSRSKISAVSIFFRQVH
jgi:putative ABC transport system permease protein